VAKSVLVAGGCGFLGSHLVDRLLVHQDIDHLVVLDNLWTGVRENLAHITDKRLCVVIGDARMVPESIRRPHRPAHRTGGTAVSGLILISTMLSAVGFIVREQLGKTAR
jgi:UDP-glucose 4-epimerase